MENLANHALRSSGRATLDTAVMQTKPGIVIVTRPTRLEGLRERWVTKKQAQFVLRAAHVLEKERRRAAAPKSQAVAAKRSRIAGGARESPPQHRSTNCSPTSTFWPMSRRTRRTIRRWSGCGASWISACRCARSTALICPASISGTPRSWSSWARMAWSPTRPSTWASCPSWPSTPIRGGLTASCFPTRSRRPAALSAACSKAAARAAR